MARGVLYTPAKAIIRHLYKDHENRISKGGHRSKSGTPHVMGRGPGRRGPPREPGGCRNTSSRSSPIVMGFGPGRPVKTRGPPHGLGGTVHVDPIFLWAAAWRGPSIIFLLGCGQAQPHPITENGPRAGPAHHIFKRSRLGPARPTNNPNSLARPARPGPAHLISTTLGAARRAPSHFQNPLPDPLPEPDHRPMTSLITYHRNRISTVDLRLLVPRSGVHSISVCAVGRRWCMQRQNEKLKESENLPTPVSYIVPGTRYRTTWYQPKGVKHSVDNTTERVTSAVLRPRIRIAGNK